MPSNLPVRILRPCNGTVTLMAELSQQPVLCSVGVRLSAALWMWFSDLRDVSVVICRA